MKLRDLAAFEKHLCEAFSIFAANYWFMGRFGRWLCVGLLLLSSVAVQAQVAAEDPCKGEQNQMNMNLCAEQQYLKADRQLNLTWKALTAKMEKVQKAQLVEVQRIWIKFRDGQCECEVAGYEGGSIVPLLQYSCLRRLTEERTAHLAAMLDEYEH
jgi:uncharacterized protein YecT (DUF1311 family)